MQLEQRKIQDEPMPLRAGIQHPEMTTRSRVLEAAMLRFAQCSYEETKLRDIARDVGVDVALVHRSFGSKENLFQEVVTLAFEPRRLFAVERDELTERLVTRVLEPSLDQALRLIDPLDIIIRNLLSREAIPILRTAFAEDVVAPLSPKLSEPARQRAALLAACLAGIGIFRHVLRVDSLLDQFDDQLQPLVARLIEEIAGHAEEGTHLSQAPAPRGRRPAKAIRKRSR